MLEKNINTNNLEAADVLIATKSPLGDLGAKSIRTWKLILSIITLLSPF
jgi:hypothetical protein